MASKKIAPPDAPTQPALEDAPTLGRFRTGWLQDTPDERDWKASHHFGAARSPAPENLALLKELATVDDQGMTSSCVAHAALTAVETRLRHMGFVPPRFSRRAAYDVGRSYERSPGQPLLDQGMFPRHMMMGLRQFGLCEEDAWPWDPEAINREIPWDVQQKATPYRIAGWYRIDSSGLSRILDIQLALAKGYPVIFGTQVGREFENWNGRGVVPVAGSDNVGGHMLCLLGYTTDNGEVIMRGVNSWSYGWGDRGLFWAGNAFLTDERASDFYVMEISG